MSKRNVIWLHIVFWIVYLLFPILYYGRFNVVSKQRLLLEMSHVLLNAVVFYTNYCIFLPTLFQKKKYGLYILSCLVLIEAFTGLRYLIEETLFPIWFGFRNYHGNYTIRFYIYDNIYFGGMALLPSYIIWSIVNHINLEKDKKDLQQEKELAELQFLKTQINPHFLFNTLNNIYALVYHQSEKALPAIMQLSELMRYVARDSNAQDKVLLTQELAYIESFIELESLRIKPKAMVEYSVEGDPHNVKIAPLLLVPFVENGFKHGVLDDVRNPFHIRIIISSSQIHLYTSNQKSKKQKTDISGIGLRNLRRRLDLLYPNKHELTIQNGEYDYICNLTIDCEA